MCGHWCRAWVWLPGSACTPPPAARGQDRGTWTWERETKGRSSLPEVGRPQQREPASRGSQQAGGDVPPRAAPCMTEPGLQETGPLPTRLGGRVTPGTAQKRDRWSAHPQKEHPLPGGLGAQGRSGRRAGLSQDVRRERQHACTFMRERVVLLGVPVFRVVALRAFPRPPPPVHSLPHDTRPSPRRDVCHSDSQRSWFTLGVALGVACSVVGLLSDTWACTHHNARQRRPTGPACSSVPRHRSHHTVSVASPCPECRRAGVTDHAAFPDRLLPLSDGHSSSPRCLGIASQLPAPWRCVIFHRLHGPQPVHPPPAGGRLGCLPVWVVRNEVAGNVTSLHGHQLSGSLGKYHGAGLLDSESVSSFGLFFFKLK